MRSFRQVSTVFFMFDFSVLKQCEAECFAFSQQLVKKDQTSVEAKPQQAQQQHQQLIKPNKRPKDVLSNMLHQVLVLLKCGNKCSQLGPTVLTSPAAPIWKSLHIVAAATALAVLTQGREISTCPHRIPGPVPSTTYLVSSLPPEELSYNFSLLTNVFVVVVWPQPS